MFSACNAMTCPAYIQNHSKVFIKKNGCKTCLLGRKIKIFFYFFEDFYGVFIFLNFLFFIFKEKWVF